jgi:hypothetical protein
MALSFHCVREAIASKIIGLYHADGVLNPADILSKHWGYQQVWKLLRPLLSGRAIHLTFSNLRAS